VLITLIIIYVRYYLYRRQISGVKCVIFLSLQIENFKLNQGWEHVIAYGGRSLSKAEQIWSTTEQECLAVLEGIKQFRTYLSRRFKIYTDHTALKYLMDQNVAVEKLGRWALKLQDFDFEIIHKPGKNNQMADALNGRSYNEGGEVFL